MRWGRKTLGGVDMLVKEGTIERDNVVKEVGEVSTLTLGRIVPW